LGTEPFAWAPFQTPRFENFIIYQFHIGSFAGRGDQFNKISSNLQDVESKFSYIREMGFNCIEPLPVHEFAMDFCLIGITQPFIAASAELQIISARKKFL